MTKQVALFGGHVALVDEADLRALRFYRWHVRKNASGNIYAASRKHHDGKVLFMHRFLMKASPGSEVDHIDGNGLNNQRSNLRICTHKENMRNRKVTGKGSSRFKGVHLCPQTGRWHARITVDGKKLHLGRFARQAEAAAAYNRAARTHYGKFAKVNSLKTKP